MTTREASWIQMAAATRTQISRAYHGDKAEVLHRLSVQNGVSDGMMRKCVTSLQLLEKLEAEGVAYPEVIRTLQAGVTEVFGRWMKDDLAAAVAAVEAHARGETTFRDLLQGQVEARKRARGRMRERSMPDPTRPKSMPPIIDRSKLKEIIIEAIAQDDGLIPSINLAMIGQILTRRSIEPRGDDMYKVKGTWG